MTNSIMNKVKESPVTAEKVGEVVKTAAKKQLENKQKIYLGPNISGLPKYTVVQSDLPKYIQGFIKECPEINKLFVPISKMAETEKRTKEKGTLEYRWYQKIIEYKNREGEN